MRYIVTGFHKSGTTLLTEILHRSGINMVISGTEDYDYDSNEKKLERESTARINHIILGTSISTLSIYRKNIKVNNEEIRNLISDEIERLDNNHKDWGFKDPALCITYKGFWMQKLGDHYVILIYRSPFETWSRYCFRFRQTNNRLSYPIRFLSSFFINLYRSWHFIDAWYEYNSRVIKINSNTDRQHCILINYKSFLSEKNSVKLLAEFTKKDLVDSRNIQLYRNKGDESKILNFMMRFYFFLTGRDCRDLLTRLDNIKDI